MDIPAAPVRTGSRLTSFTGVFGALTLSLILSGAAGLIYQVVWFRVLGLIFGVTVQASSAVLAAFMAGLALGSFFAGRYVDSMRRPMVVYGVVEIFIGLFGFFSLFAFDALQPVYRSLAGDGTGSIAALTSLRFFLSFLIMLVPTTMMGATLPLVVKGMAQRSSETSHHISWLYAVNTFGAILGAFSAGFYLIGEHGTLVTVGVAATFNIVIGVGWLVFHRQSTVQRDVPEVVPATVDEKPLSPVMARIVLVGYGVSGAVALASEVIWTRILSGIFPGTVYAFSLMLCAILTGIAVGSWAIDRIIQTRRNWLIVFGLLQVSMALTSMLSIVVMSQGYRFEALLRGPTGRDTEQLLLGDPWFMALFAMLAIFPAAFTMGVIFPVAAKIYGAGHSDVGRRVAHIYAVNVLGGLSGSLLGGLVLIPALGAQRALIMLSGISALIAIAVFGLRGGRRRLTFVGATIAAYVLAVVLTPNLYDQLFSTNPYGETTVWYREDADATIRVAKDKDGAQIIYVNSDGQNTDAQPELVYHYQLGLLGPLLHPAPKEVLVVGLAAGITSGAASMHPDTHLTVAELHPGVIEAARLFEHANFNLLDKDNVTILPVDGRNHLLLSGKQYDVIESDPMWPTNAGAAVVYSQDYYKLAAAALKDNGLMVQWMDRSLPEPAYKMMVRTFASAFPYTTMWYHGTMLVGSKQPLRIDREVIDEKFEDPELRALMDWVGIRSANDLLREFVAQPEELQAYLGDGPIVTDRNPYIEYIQNRPADGAGADLRWRRVAGFLTPREQQGDGIIFGDPTMPALLNAYTSAQLPNLVLPFNPKGREREADTILREFVSKHDRVWFVPWWQNDADVYIERWLNVNGYQALDRSLGNIRMTLYASPRADQALQPMDFGFGNDFRLTGWASDKTSVAVGDLARITLEWRAQRAIDQNIKVLLQLLDDRGRTVATIDRLPLDSPTDRVASGERLVDRYGLLVPPGTPAGSYQLSVTMYEEETGNRLVPQNPNAAGQRVVLGTMTVTDPTRKLSPEAVDATTLSTRVYGPLRFAGYTLDDSAKRPGDFVQATLYWQLLADNATRPVRMIVGDPANPAGEVAVQVQGANGAIVRSDPAVRIKPGTPAGKYDAYLVVEGSEPYYLGTMSVVAPPTRTPPATPRTAVNATFGDSIVLNGATVNAGTSNVTVDLVWSASKDIPTGYTVFVHVLDAEGRIIGQSDAVPSAGAAPTSSWAVGERIGDRHTISVPGGAASIAVGLYDPATFQRLTSGSADRIVLPIS